LANTSQKSSFKPTEKDLAGFKGEYGFFHLFGRYFFAGIIIIILAVYVGLLLFGTNSAEVLYELRAQKRSLEERIRFLKEENARLQKEYFELKELEAEE